MDVPKTIFFLLISLIPMSDSVESRVREAQKDGVKGPKEEMREKITLIKRILDEVSALAEICGACDSQPCLNGGTCIDEANGKYSCACAIGWTGDQCEKCHTALGMESGKIKDDQITSSSNEADRQASRGRLNFEVYPGKPGSWSSRVKDNDQWLQVDLGTGKRNVSGIATQGGTNYRGKARWVAKYRLAFSDDGVNFHYYKGGEATDKVFVGNKDRDTVVYNELSQPITSRYIRIRPIPIGNRRKVFAMRVELYGCQEIKPCDSSPCINGGNCTNEADGNFTCQCPSGWTGDTCEKQLAKGLSNSNIIGDNQNYLVMLSRWLRPVSQSNGQWILCWRASFHGWDVATFQSLCHHKGPTVTIVKDTNNNIFGGYTSISWRGGTHYRNDSKAFLFSLKNPTNNPRKLPQLDSSNPYSVYEQPNFGPSFGSNHDLNIADHANMNSYSYEKLGYAYTVPSGIPGDPFLTENNYFRANEIEIFYERAE
ncbi:uncharacterized protein [Acropora muricata]|uniref:uncharacterized protein isoform X2 n=1 Tax=Acropora muricata TaxID=159855 RepID=UPI0034E3D4BF